MLREGELVGGLDAASAAVTEMGYDVAKKLGDGLLTLFGYPVAHENDAERAGAVVLAIQHALADVSRRNAARESRSRPPASVSTPGRRRRARGEIYGDVANIAAREQALAEPGAVLITTRVQHAVFVIAEDRGTACAQGRARGDGAVPARGARAAAAAVPGSAISRRSSAATTR